MSHDQHLPVNLSLPIDRSILSDRPSVLFLSLSLALSDFFNRLFSTSLSLALFYLFTRSFSRAEALYRTTGDLRETRPYFAIVFRFRSAFELLVTLFPMVTEPNTTAGLFNRRIFQLLCVRFVYSSFDDCRRCLERVHPFNFVQLCIRRRRQRGSSLFLLNTTDLRRGRRLLTAPDLWPALKIRRPNVTVLNPRWQAILMRLFSFRFRITKILEAERSATTSVNAARANPWHFGLKDAKRIYTPRGTFAWAFAWFYETVASHRISSIR